MGCNISCTAHRGSGIKSEEKVHNVVNKNNDNEIKSSLKTKVSDSFKKRITNEDEKSTNKDKNFFHDGKNNEHFNQTRLININNNNNSDAYINKNITNIEKQSDILNETNDNIDDESKEKHNINKNYEKEDKEMVKVCPVITDHHKHLLLTTWSCLVDNISKVGVITFTRLFETHPEVQEVFMPFREIDKNDLIYSKQLRSHALRVMAIVQKIIARLNEMKKCEELLNELGCKHIVYGAKVDYVDLVGEQFIYAIKPSLGDMWTNEVEGAWIQLFKFISYNMKTKMQ